MLKNVCDWVFAFLAVNLFAWVFLFIVIGLFSGCDALVADNPACIYDCASSSAYTGGVR